MYIRVARDRNELESAFVLVHREYRKRGYVADDTTLRVILHNALPQTATFVGIDESGRVGATGTVVPDSPLGLPMDDCYRAEMDALRARGTPCEIVMLAVDSDIVADLSPRPAVPFVIAFCKSLVDYARTVLSANFICVAVNPRHEAAFERYLFRPLGALRPYRSVNDAPAVAKYLDLASIPSRLAEEGGKNRWALFGGAPTDPANFSGKAILRAEDLSYFFREKTNVFSTAAAERLEYIAGCYDAADVAEADAKTSGTVA